jgi:hypothetical protein
MLTKSRSAALALVVLFGSMTLTGCGAGGPKSSGIFGEDFGTDSGTDSGGSEDQGSVDSGWTASEGDDGEGNQATCNFSDEDSPGDLVRCNVYFDAKNDSTIPLEYYGYTYLVVDGAVFQSEDRYAESRMINPGSYAYKNGYNTFYIPYGGYISALYKADGPNDPHLFDLSLNISIINGD